MSAMAGLDWESDLSFAPLFDDISKDAGIPPIQNAASSVSQPPAPTATNDNAISDGAIGETEYITIPNEIVIANGTVDAQTFGSNTDTDETSDDAEDVAFQPAPNGEVVLTLRTIQECNRKGAPPQQQHVFQQPARQTANQHIKTSSASLPFHNQSAPRVKTREHSSTKCRSISQRKLARSAAMVLKLPSKTTTKSVSREIERRVGTKTATFWARNRLNLRSTGIEYMYNAKYMYCSS